jgi:hypothetical protein
MGYEPTVADVEAAGLVLGDIIDRSDSMDVEEALDFRLAAERLRASCNDTIAMLDTQLKRIMEGGVERHGRRYFKTRKKEKQRFAHSTIAGAVIKASTPEGATASQAARTAVDLMGKIYVSDSTSARTGALHALGLNTDRHRPESVRTYEQGDEIIDFEQLPGGR